MMLMMLMMIDDDDDDQKNHHPSPKMMAFSSPLQAHWANSPSYSKKNRKKTLSTWSYPLH
jgi:hypothetical protein